LLLHHPFLPLMPPLRLQPGISCDLHGFVRLICC
jgi:hypothetical protein